MRKTVSWWFMTFLFMFGIFLSMPTLLNAKVTAATYNKDSKTLTFAIVSDAEYNQALKQSFMVCWKGDDVLNADKPQWRSYSWLIDHVVIHESFADARPVTIASWFKECREIVSISGLRYLNTSEVTNMDAVFSGCVSLRDIDLSNFDTSKTISMEGMFYNCRSLKSLDLSKFNTYNVTSMKEMFDGCSSLISLDLKNFLTYNVTNMNRMFDGCEQLTNLNVSKFVTQRVKDMGFMFYGCKSLKNLNVTSFNTSNVKSMYSMFSFCQSLESLDLSNFNTQNVTEMTGMFKECRTLQSIDLSSFNTSNVKYMSGMFNACLKLIKLNLRSFDTKNVVSMDNMFLFCPKLKTIICGGSWNTESSTNMFYQCYSLVGAIAYDENKVDATYANPDNGYFTKYKNYPLKICGVRIDNFNCDDLRVIDGVIIRSEDGYAYYNPEKYSLHLCGVAICSIDKSAIWFESGYAGITFNMKVEEDLQGYSVSVIGSSSSQTALPPVIDLYDDANISGSGKLFVCGIPSRAGFSGTVGTANYAVPAIIAHRGATFYDAEVSAVGTYGICGSTTSVSDESLAIFGDDSFVTAEGTEGGSICNFSKFYNSLAIRAPEGAKWTDNAVRFNGQIVKEEVIIGPPIIRTGIFIAGQEVTNVNSSDLGVISGVSLADESSYLRYDWDRNTLEMEGAIINGGLRNTCKGLTIKVGKPYLLGTFVSNDKGDGLTIEAPTTIKGNGGYYKGTYESVMIVSGDDTAISLLGPDAEFTVEDATIIAYSNKGCGISGEMCASQAGGVDYNGIINIKGMSLIQSQGPLYSIGLLKSLNLGEHILIGQPEGAVFRNHYVCLDNTPVKGEYVAIGYYFPCDVNLDGNVDISDIVAVINTIAGGTTYKSTADVNSDKNIDISDIVAIINYIAGGE